MKPRNLSPQQMFIRMAERHQPALSFDSLGLPFPEWKAQVKPRVLATLGEWPDFVAPNPELTIEWEDRGVLKRRYLIDVGPDISAAVQVNMPLDFGGTARLPAILCWHGHGRFGKEPMMGNVGEPEVQNDIQRFNYDYGHQMALKGYVTYALDWLGCGERSDVQKPHNLATAGGRDWCNLYYLHATMFGQTNMSINLAHAKAATDFVCSLPEVQSDRLGVMGLSGGGALAIWTALTDDRFRAIEVICYSDLWELFGIRDINYCGSQITPGLFKLINVPDLQGLLAPMPLLVDIGACDRCFQPANAMACYRRVAEIYRAAQAEDLLQLDLFSGEHAWSGRKSPSFFRQHLQL